MEVELDIINSYCVATPHLQNDNWLVSLLNLVRKQVTTHTEQPYSLLPSIWLNLQFKNPPLNCYHLDALDNFN